MYLFILNLVDCCPWGFIEFEHFLEGVFVQKYKKNVQIQ